MLITEYISKALELAEYFLDENGIIVVKVPNTTFFSQGSTFEEARENLKDAVEGNIIVSLQMGFDLPVLDTVCFETKSKELLNA